MISIHALLAESDVDDRFTVHTGHYFYPRSPCGERRIWPYQRHFAPDISIHALLAESDIKNPEAVSKYMIFLSTLSLRRATKKARFDANRPCISIHALLAESDCGRRVGMPVAGHFYPRSPCGERLETLRTVKVKKTFLSTLSLRRATDLQTLQQYRFVISIHALLAESDSAKSTPEEVYR